MNMFEVKSCGLRGEKYKKLLEACRWPRCFRVPARGHKDCQDHDLASRCAESFGPGNGPKPNRETPWRQRLFRTRSSRPRLLRTWRSAFGHLTTCGGPRPHVDLNVNNRSKQRTGQKTTAPSLFTWHVHHAVQSKVLFCATNSRAKAFWDTRGPFVFSQFTEGFTAAPALRVQARAVSQIWQVGLGLGLSLAGVVQLAFVNAIESRAVSLQISQSSTGTGKCLHTHTGGTRSAVHFRMRVSANHGVSFLQGAANNSNNSEKRNRLSDHAPFA